MTTVPVVLPPGLENDPDVYAAMKRLALASIESAIDLLETGAPQIQTTIVRLLIPQVTRSLSAGGADADEDLKAAVTKMYDEVRESMGGSGE